MVNTRQCPECGKQYGSKARFCRHDGAQLIDLAPKSGPEPGRGRVNPGPGARGVVSLPGVAAQTQKGTASLLDAEEEHGSFVGRVIAGRFLLEQFLGSGATGLVYRATHKVLNRPMAVKLLKREFIWDERSLLRFLREARTCSVMDHPNIVYLYDFGRDELGEPYLVIEYVDGRTLLSAIHSSPTRTLPVSRVLNIMLQLAHALVVGFQFGDVARGALVGQQLRAHAHAARRGGQHIGCGELQCAGARPGDADRVSGCASHGSDLRRRQTHRSHLERV